MRAMPNDAELRRQGYEVWAKAYCLFHGWDPAGLAGWDVLDHWDVLDQPGPPPIQMAAAAGAGRPATAQERAAIRVVDPEIARTQKNFAAVRELARMVEEDQAREAREFAREGLAAIERDFRPEGHRPACYRTWSELAAARPKPAPAVRMSAATQDDPLQVLADAFEVLPVIDQHAVLCAIGMADESPDPQHAAVDRQLVIDEPNLAALVAAMKSLSDDDRTRVLELSAGIWAQKAMVAMGRDGFRT